MENITNFNDDGPTVLTTRWVEVNFQKEGIHCFPRAGTDPTLADVSFLQYPHRHIFHFTVRVEVFHNDRDIEFIQLKRECEAMFDDKVIDINSHSCEDMCELIYNNLSANFKYYSRQMIIKCFEDGENGSIVEYKHMGDNY